MIFIISPNQTDSHIIYLPFFSFNGHEYKSPVYATLLIFELILSIFCVLLTIRMCWTLWTSRVFHINISIISMGYFIQYFELLVGKLLIVLYQYGYFEIQGIPSNRPYLSWASKNPIQMPTIQKIDDALPLFIGSFMIWHYMMSMVFFIFFYNLERVIATFLLGSYEKHSRSYISISILVVANVLTLKIAHMLFYFQIEFTPSVIICSGIVIIAMTMYLIVMFYNIRLTNNLKNDTARKRLKKFDKYSLAYRFQLEENLKVFMLIKQVIISIGTYVLLNILSIFVINSNFLSASFNLTLVFLVENCLLLNPLLICTVTMCSVEPWRLILLRDINFLVCGLLRLQRFKIHHVKSMEVMAQGEADIYFRDLKNMWA